jgi:hypothetical protein
MTLVNRASDERAMNVSAGLWPQFLNLPIGAVKQIRQLSHVDPDTPRLIGEQVSDPLFSELGVSLHRSIF